MKRLFILLLCLCLPAFSTYAKKKISGYYVTQRNDTIRGTFLVPFGFLGTEPSYERLQYRVKFLDANGEKYTLLPIVIKCFVLDFDGEKITYLSRKDMVSSMFAVGEARFFKLKMDGYLKLFEYYVRRNSGGMPNGLGGFSPGYSYTEDRYCLQKGDGSLKRIRGLFFKKEMSEYVSDYPELAQRILNKEYRSRDMVAIVEEYNKWVENRAKRVSSTPEGEL